MVASRHIASRAQQAGQMAVWVLTVACALLAAPGAYADLSIAPNALAAGLPAVAAANNLPDVQFAGDVCSAAAEQAGEPVSSPVVDLQDLSTSLVLPVADRSGRQVANAMHGPAHPSAEPQVKTLPPPPGSLSVALSGLATLGAFRLARQIKQISFAPVPEWYHTGGPGQVGHATPLPLDLTASMLPLCWYEHAVALLDLASKPTPQGGWWEFRSHFQSQWFVPTIASRGPPASY